MAWTTPRTWTTGELVTAAIMNTHVRDNLSDLDTDRVPVGTVVSFGGSSAPSGWLICAGQEVSQTTYADLYTVLGSTFNTGGESGGNFRVPDLRGRVAVGKDNMNSSNAGRVDSGSAHGVDGDTLGAAGGVDEHQLTTNELAAHTHPVYKQGAGGAATTGFQDVANGDATTGVTNSTGGDAAHTNMPPFIIMNKIVKY